MMQVLLSTLALVTPDITLVNKTALLNESNKYIIAKIWDVYLINEEKKTAKIYPQQISHYQVSVENTSEAFFNVTKIDGSEICFTQYFTHPDKVECILLIKQQAGKYNITPEMKHFFVQSNSETVSNVEFQIQREQLHDDKKSNTWVIWVVVSVVIGVLAVVATVIFYMRHKKQKTQIYSEIDALNYIQIFNQLFRLVLTLFTQITQNQDNIFIQSNSQTITKTEWEQHKDDQYNYNWIIIVIFYVSMIVLFYTLSCNYCVINNLYNINVRQNFQR
ncbi:Hypothetical_protein [Hexamita inflata]|uniref:Hypothetical_protein n=1 Tax=Hexamita inflata TaxID=28002 RepID=A0AA86PP78_9EUKA|nr:Hypothetical protein HINF_LOCUS31279 [Hexamita inflata]